MLIPDKTISRLSNLIEKRLNRADIKAICRLILIVTVALFSLSFLTQQNGRTIFGPPLGADFAAYYIAGRIFKDTDPGRIYDRALERVRYHELFPDLDPDLELPYLNAPFFVLPFALLSEIPYAPAFLCWVFLSLLLFAAGFEMLWRTMRTAEKADRSIMLLLSVSYMPFLVECLAGGQTAAFGFAVMSSAVYHESRRRQVLSGAILALCSYKPTLLVLIAPMLIVTRRYRTFAGLCIGISVLALLSISAIGYKASYDYIDLLLSYSRATANSTSTFMNWKYVDLNSFFRSLVPGNSSWRWALLILAATPLAGYLIRFWRLTDRHDPCDRAAQWAATITMTMVLNIYLGIYDTTLMILSALLMTDALDRWAGKEQLEIPRNWRLLCLVLYLTPWVTQPIARLTRIQMFTLVLIGVGIYQMRRTLTRDQLSESAGLGGRIKLPSLFT